MPATIHPDLTTEHGVAALRRQADRNRLVAERHREDAERLLNRAARFEEYAAADDREADKIARWGAADLNPCRREGAHLRAQRHPRTDCPCGYAETDG